MHKRTLSFLLTVLLTFSFAACHDEGIERIGTPFILPETCQWKSDIEKDKLHRIENKQQLKEMVYTKMEENLPKINFDNTSILLVSKELSHTGYEIESSLEATSQLSYVFRITVKETTMPLIATPMTYNVAISTEKINKRAAISYEIELPY